MIKFNNYPPTEPGDVELTEAAVYAVIKASTLNRGFSHSLERPENDQATLMYAYGQAIGYAIFASVWENHLLQSEIREISRPIMEQVQAIAQTGESEFSTGFSYALSEGARNTGVEV